MTARKRLTTKQPATITHGTKYSHAYGEKEYMSPYMTLAQSSNVTAWMMAISANAMLSNELMPCFGLAS
eukprot:3791698-Prymnesium_polylepis.1